MTHSELPVVMERAPELQRSITLDEYHRMIEAGVFGEDEHVELLDGVLVRMSPHSPAHAQVIARLTHAFVRALGDAYVVRVQLPITLVPMSEPEPDFAIVTAEEAEAPEHHPQHPLLVVEVGVSSVEPDRTIKAELYARARIPEYWLVDVPARRVEVRTEPDSRRARYRKVSRRTRGTLVPVELGAPVLDIPSLFR